MAVPLTPGPPGRWRCVGVEAARRRCRGPAFPAPCWCRGRGRGRVLSACHRIAVTVAGLFSAGPDPDSSGVRPTRAARALHHAVRRVRDGHALPAPFDRADASTGDGLRRCGPRTCIPGHDHGEPDPPAGV
ncbi:hypothetical protein GCM10023083_86620 [Streptomyces phyllanthi]